MADQRTSCRFFCRLSSAVLELTLISILYIDAFVQYLATKFAGFCKLQIPCLLCSRLDHILGKGKPGFVRDLLCKTHMTEISSLVYCHAHERLAYIHHLCEYCLLSYAADKKLSPDTHKLFVAKLGSGLEDNDADVLQCKSCGDDEAGFSQMKPCSCCSKPFSNKEHKFLQTKPKGADIGDVGRSVPSTTGHGHLHRRRAFNKRRDKSSGLNPSRQKGHGSEDLKEVDRFLQPIFSNNSNAVFADNMAREKLIHPDPITDKTPLVASTRQLHATDSAKLKLRSIPPPPSYEQIFEQVPADVPDGMIPPDSEITKTLSSDMNWKASQRGKESSSSKQPPMNLCDTYKLNVGNKGSFLSPRFADIVIGKDSYRAHEDLKSMLSQISTARGIELSSEMIFSPRPLVQGDELKSSDSSDSVILQNILKRVSVEKNELSANSFDGSLVNKYEGESVLDHLKRQVELDRKSMSILYKELEEERNASAIAANQAMAMITRLQEEKAAMQMEALQYQRMMEEQAEYDQEALQISSELLAQRENQILDMECELESYRRRFRAEALLD